MFGYAKRKTFLIDTKGKIARSSDSINPKTHSEDVLKILETVA